MQKDCCGYYRHEAVVRIQMQSSDQAVGKSPAAMTEFCVVLAVNAPRVVTNIIRLLTVSSIYVIVVLNAANLSQCHKSC